METTIGKLTVNGVDFTPPAFKVRNTDALFMEMGESHATVRVLSERDQRIRRRLRRLPGPVGRWAVRRWAPGRTAAMVGVHPTHNATFKVHATKSI